MSYWKKYKKTNPQIDIERKGNDSAVHDDSVYRIRSLREKSEDAKRKAVLINKMIPAMQKLKAFRERDPKIKELSQKLNSKLKFAQEENTMLVVNYWMLDLGD